jgi:hypothetical protein
MLDFLASVHGSVPVIQEMKLGLFIESIHPIYACLQTDTVKALW